MIKAIFFDLDDTLIWDQKSVDVAFQLTCNKAKEKYNLDPKLLEVKVRAAAREFYSSYETFSYTQLIGINPFEALWGEFDDQGEPLQRLRELVPIYRKAAWTFGLKAVGIDDANLGADLANHFPFERRKHPFVFEDTFSVLNRLKKDYRLLLLTNGSPNLQSTKLSLTPELLPYFEKIVISGDFGKGKPSPDIFNHALKLMGLQNSEVLMVGDNLHTDILGANQAGIQSVWINRKNKKTQDILPAYEIRRLEDIIQLLKELNHDESFL